MKVFIFDLLPYDRHFEDYKRDKLIPYPLPRDHWDPEIGARTCCRRSPASCPRRWRRAIRSACAAAAKAAPRRRSASWSTPWSMRSPTTA